MIDVILSLDLGQQNDYSVLTLMKVIYNSDGVSSYHIPYLKRYPIRTSYVAVVDHVAEFMEDPRLKDCELVVDYTGVGHPVVDLFRHNGVNPICVNITGGLKVNWSAGRTVSVPKSTLISALQVVFQNYRIKISAAVDHIDILENEFVSFKAKITNKGSSKFEASSGEHDDIVMSIALGIWYGEYINNRKVFCVSG